MNPRAHRSIGRLPLGLFAAIYLPAFVLGSTRNAFILAAILVRSGSRPLQTLWRLPWLAFAPCFLPVRGLRAIARASVWIPPEEEAEMLARLHERMRAHSDQVAQQGRVQTPSHAGLRQIRESCLTQLFQQTLYQAPDPTALHILSRYNYAADAFRDLLDYCHSTGKLHSRAAVLEAVDSFVTRLKLFLEESSSPAAPLGSLPPAGAFAFLDESEVRDPRGLADHAARLRRAYWAFHAHLQNARGQAGTAHDVLDLLREDLPKDSLGAVFQYERAVQSVQLLLHLVRRGCLPSSPVVLRPGVDALCRRLHLRPVLQSA